MMEINGKKHKTAIVHDWFCNMGGGDKVAEKFLDIMPDSPIYVSCFLEKSLTSRLKEADIRASFLQKRINQKKDNHQSFLPLMPTAFESFDLNEFDIVLSSSSCCAKGVITNPNTVHICYCHTPMRYAWEFMYEYTEKMGRTKRFLISLMMTYMKMWDALSAKRVDFFIANSWNVANRIKKYYGREATVINPPIDTEFFSPSNGEKGEFYLCVSRLVKYKRIDLAIQACNTLKVPLVIIGQGAEMDYLKSIAGDTVTILGRQSDDVIRDYYRRCKAFIFPGEEDFGMTPLEAQACGRPVIAYGKGGALETVVDGKTGVFFKEQTVQSLCDAIKEFERKSFSVENCRKQAENFSTQVFYEEMKKFFGEIMSINRSQQ
ncbi:MAG: glycosyltransferase [Suilimivivens sp.]